MKKEYEMPVAEKVQFNYTEQVVASCDEFTTKAKGTPGGCTLVTTTNFGGTMGWGLCPQSVEKEETMKLYQIGSVALAAPVLPAPFAPFAAETDQEAMIHLTMKETPISIPNGAVKHENVNMFHVYTLPDGNWVYEYIEDGSRLWVNSDYSSMEYSGSAPDTGNAMTNLVRLAVQCRLLKEGTLTLHAACVEQDGKAILLSATSGTGKSTRAIHWVESLGASWISGDRPSLNVASSMVISGPWDGKEQVFCPKQVPLGYLCEVRRAPFTKVRQLTVKQAYDFLITQLFVPMWDTELAAMAMALLRCLIRKKGVYRVFCDQTLQAAKETEDILFRHPEQIENQNEEEIIEMKLKPGFVVRCVAGEYMAMPTGENIAAFQGTVVLNGVSAFVLEHMVNPVSKEDLLEMLLAEYEVTRERAERDLDTLLEKFRSYDMIE